MHHLLRPMFPSQKSIFLLHQYFLYNPWLQKLYHRHVKDKAHFLIGPIRINIKLGKYFDGALLNSITIWQKILKQLLFHLGYFSPNSVIFFKHHGLSLSPYYFSFFFHLSFNALSLSNRLSFCNLCITNDLSNSSTTN